MRTSPRTQRRSLRESKDLFSKVFRGSPTAISITRLADGAFLDVNDAFLHLLGYERAELLGQTSLAIGLWVEHRDREEIVETLRAQGSLRNGKVALRTRSGDVKDVILNVELLDLAAQPCAISTVYDVTEANRLEGKLAYQARLLADVHDAILATDGRFQITAWNRAAEEMYGWKSEEVIGRLVQDVIRSDLTDDQRAAALRSLAETGRYQVEIVQYRKDGTPLFVSGKTIALHDGEGRITGYVSANQDLTDRKRAEEAVRFQSERFRFVADISRAFAEAGFEYESVLKTVVERTAHLIGDACVLTLLSADGRHARAVAFHHPRPETREALARTLQGWQGKVDSPLFRPLLAGQSILLATPPPSDVRSLADAELRPYLDEVGISSLLMVPLRVQRKVIGTLGVSRDPLGRAYTRDDQLLLQDVADRAALTIQNARLFQSVSEHRQTLRTLSARLVSTQELERSTVARELHDEVGQLLTSLKLRLEASDRAGTAGPREQVTEMAARVLERIKDLSLNLRPPMLDDLGLVPTLLWHVGRFTAQTGVRVHFHHRGVGERLAPETELAMFRIIQEALTNVARHAGTREAVAELSRRDGMVQARIEDCGQGFDPAALSPSSSGLIGMRERASLLGGSLSIETSRGGGTRVVASLPAALARSGAPADE